ncbi:MAG TPA: hypothetical protein VFN88_04615, partial [Caulobacteraceae bacterium]|nr:hypothetical protein [Caulobacteraceae bacterium]
MKNGLLLMLAGAACAALASGAIAADQKAPAKATKAAYKAPLAADGHPDLEGVWNNSSMTPLERLPRFGNRLVMTPEEVKTQEAAEQDYLNQENAPTDPKLKTEDLPEHCGRDASVGFNPGGVNLTKAGCGYNNAWIDPGDKFMRVGGEPRTSLITSTADGRLPKTTADYTARMQERRKIMNGSADNPENRSTGDRCITSWANHAGPVMLSTTYNNNYQFVQTKDTIAIEAEVLHDVRIVHMNAQHGPKELHPFYGDSIGHWDGDTLVVETINYSPNTTLRGAYQDLKVTERFTRVGPDKMLYQFKVED